jgi:hypothetical protein
MFHANVKCFLDDKQMSLALRTVCYQDVILIQYLLLLLKLQVKDNHALDKKTSFLQGIFDTNTF